MTEPRMIRNTSEPMRCDWPAGTFVQGGSRGVVFGGADGPYRTAFVEAFPDSTFLRGEGSTIEEAERACWARYQALRSCPTYPAHGPWDRRSYRNGSAYCGGCGGWFPNRVTGLAELPDEGAKPSMLERVFRGDDDALAEVVDAVTNVDQLPERAEQP